VRNPARILAVDDTSENLEILRLRLEAKGYEVVTASDGEEGLSRARELEPDLILLDIMMPKLDGISVVRMLKQDETLRAIPVILVTAKADVRDVVEGLDAGGDDYLTKPFEHAALLARVRSMLRQKALYDTVQDQTLMLRQQARELAEWNETLKERVAKQLAEIERIGRLRRFLAPQIADLIMSSRDESWLGSHRRDIAVLFCDLRGFTTFAETGEPEEVMALLRDYHHLLGPLIYRFEGTLDRFTGDGLLVFFNDPLPCPDPAERAVRLAVSMREAVRALADRWRKRGHQIGFGIGVAQGFATLGLIGFEERSDYSAVGTVTNLAARLCAEAKDGEILVTTRVASAIEPFARLANMGEIALKGLSRPMAVSNVIGLKAG
jgi:class 3 adenylate cyclase/CheY-like chemotaxis protein